MNKKSKRADERSDMLQSDAVERGMCRSLTYLTYQDQYPIGQFGCLNAVDGVKSRKVIFSARSFLRQGYKSTSEDQRVMPYPNPTPEKSISVLFSNKKSFKIDAWSVAGTHNSICSIPSL